MPSLSPSDVQKSLGKIKKPLKSLGPKNTLSVCMIVKNEESNIEAAIRSFLPFADEIVVNDTGSTDKTLSILQRLPVKVIQTEWVGDFSAARNASIKAATSSWIIWMDADDRVPPEECDAFRKLKTAPLDRCFAFQIVNTQAGLAIGTRFMQTRMFPNNREIYFERKVHEQVIYTCAKLGLHSFAVETIIHHTGYENAGLKRTKAQRNIDLLKENPDRNIDPILGMQEGDSYAILEQWDLSIESYLHAYNIPNAKNIHRDAFNEIPNCIGRGYIAKRDYNKAREWFEIGLKNDSSKIEPYFYTAESYFKENNYEKALIWFNKTLAQKRTFSSVANQFDVMRMYSFNYLCKIETENKNWKNVVAFSESFLTEYPQIVESRIYLAKSHLSLKNNTLAYKYFVEAIEMNPKADPQIWNGFFWLLSEMKIADSEKEKWIKLREKSLVEPSSISDNVDFSENDKPLLSICMIVKNEAKGIRNCLDSIKGLNAELIVVDTGSADQTVSIVKEYTDKIFHFDWINDFSSARNFSFSKASGKWILWLDADDVLPSSELLRIKNLIEKNKNELNTAYGFSVMNTQDKGITGSVFNQIRLVPNSEKIRFIGKVHEQLMPSLQKNKVAVEFLPIKIWHTGYVNDEVVESKQRRNLEIMQLEMKEDASAITAVKIYSVGACYQDLKEYDNAKTEYVKAINQAELVGEDPHILELAPLKIAECLAQESKYEMALNMIENAIIKFPGNPEYIRLKAQIEEVKGDFESALLSNLKMLFFQEKQSFFPVDYQLLKFKAIRFLGMYFAEKNKTLAVRILRLGKALKEGEVVSPQKVLALLYEEEEFKVGIKLLEISMDFKPQSEDYVNLAKLQIIENYAEKAIETLKLGRQNFPLSDEIKELEMLLFNDLGISV